MPMPPSARAAMNASTPVASADHTAPTRYSNPMSISVGRRPSVSASHAPSSEPATVPYKAAATAMPWVPGSRCHKAWIVCSAPEMTTVSKPNRNPARAEVMDHRMMRPCIPLPRPSLQESAF